MALQAEILPRLLFDLPMRVVAGGAVKAVGTANLVRAGNLPERPHVGVAAVAGAWGIRTQVVRRAAQRGRVPGWLDIGRGAALIAVSRDLIGGHGHGGQRRMHRGVGRFGGGGRSRRHVVVAAVTIDAGHAAIGVPRTPPLGAFGAGILLVATQAGLGPRHRVALLETEDQPRLLAAGFQVTAGRPVTAFARVATMHVFSKCFGVRPVARYAQLVIIDVVGAGDRRHCPFDLLVGHLGEEVVGPRPAWIKLGLRAARHLMGRPAGDRYRGQQARDQNCRDTNAVTDYLRIPVSHSYASLR